MSEDREKYPNPRDQDIMAGDRRLSRPDASLPDWEVPDTSYRPIPIVWFTAALLTQMVLIGALFALLAGRSGTAMLILTALGTGGIAAWTWDRGMKDAGLAWKVATAITLALNLMLVAGAALAS